MHLLASLCVTTSCITFLVWRQEELSRINSSLFGPERKAALCQLLEKEAELIASIGRHKLVADKHQEKLQIKHLLNTVNEQTIILELFM